MTSTLLLLCCLLAVAQAALEFDVCPFSVTVQEEEGDAAFVVSVEAIGGIGIEYHFVSSFSGTDYSQVSHDDNHLLFIQDPSVGDVTTRINIDADSLRTSDSDFKLRVFIAATDNSGNRGVCSIVITFEDINDNPPAFSQSVYPATIAENSANGTSILTFEVTDPDNVFNAVNFLTIISGNDDDMLKLTSMTSC
jgi:hypothetical protein